MYHLQHKYLCMYRIQYYTVRHDNGEALVIFRHTKASPKLPSSASLPTLLVLLPPMYIYRNCVLLPLSGCWFLGSIDASFSPPPCRLCFSSPSPSAVKEEKLGPRVYVLSPWWRWWRFCGRSTHSVILASRGASHTLALSTERTGKGLWGFEEILCEMSENFISNQKEIRSINLPFGIKLLTWTNHQNILNFLQYYCIKVCSGQMRI